MDHLHHALTGSGLALIGTTEGDGKMRERSTWAVSATAMLVAGVLTLGTSASAVGSDADPAPEVAELSEAEIIAAAEAAAPDTAEPVVVASRDLPPSQAAAFEPMPLMAPAPAVQWPEPITALRPSRPGRPVEAGDSADGFALRAARETAARGQASTVGRMRAQVLDQDAARRAGVDGVLMQVTNPTGDAAQVDVAVEYPAIADAFGGDWASRLHLVSLPDCALTTPNRPECRVQTPVEATNDVAASMMRATVDSAALGVMALAADTEGSSGNWSATPLSASASWQVSAQTGAFSWSYPMRVPPAVGGPEPALALDYSAASVDGRVASTNNQTSWVGDGWSLETGYVERKYVSCSDDLVGGNNEGQTTYDLCWRSDNATLVLNGQALELVKDATTGTWRAKDDDGTKVERLHLSSPTNGDDDGEYWKVTTTDGTQYVFGRGTRPSDGLALNSAWTVPVFGNNADEPCRASTFAASSCTQAWRWNLEYVVDPSGNTMTYVYAAETNNYGRNLGTAVSSYVRGGYLTRIEYGQRQGSEDSATAPARVVFDVSERCIPATGVDCAPSSLTSATARSWPDVPFDQICTSSTACPSQVAPTFFTRKRLTAVTTQVLSGATYQDVDRWTLAHTFPDPGDGGASLWLDKISHTGLAGSPAVTLPDVQFYGTHMPNRTNTVGSFGPPMNRFRLTGIASETGASTTIRYTAPDCSTTDIPASPDTNTRRCMPVVWDPAGDAGPITEYFHKYLVESIAADPGTGLAVETHYEYQGTPAWRYDDSPLTAEAYRTWGDFRGYEVVAVVTGAPDATDRLRTGYRYLRGMDGDKLSGGGTRSVVVDGIVDEDRLNGFLREQVTYNGTDVVTATLSWPWLSAPTATAADGTQARFLDVAQTQTRTPLAAGGERTTRTVTTYESTYGTPTQVEDQGDVASAADDRCTRLEYARNPALNIVAQVARVEAVGVACSATPARPGDVISDVRTAYDGLDVGAAPTRGLPTATLRVASYDGSTPVLVNESTTTYDQHGRPLTSTDALDRTTTTAYTPATGGPVSSTTVTSPDPDGAGTLTAQVTTTEVNPAWGSPTKVTDPNGKVTTARYDALGRLTGVWLPGRPQATKTPNTTYEYLISASGVNAVTSKSLTAAEGYLSTVTLYDALLRPVQTQSPSLDGKHAGRVVTDTEYDSRGLVTATNGQWFTTGTPGTTPVGTIGDIPSRTVTAYDGAGRQTASIFLVDSAERWRTTTTYGGDRTSIDPPAGAVPTTTITDARGQTVELRQHTGAAPSTAYQATTYTYDDAGRLLGMSDAAGNDWSYTYDLRGRQIASTDPDKGATTTTYDDAGQVLTVTDARGQTLTNVYDQLGRRTQLREGSATGTLRASWMYDTLAKGQLTSATRYDAGAEYVTAITGYDDGYRPLGQSVTIPAAEGALAGTYATTLAYMPNGQPKSVRLAAAGGLLNETITTYYDALSMPQGLSGGSSGLYVSTAKYDWNGQPIQVGLGNTAGKMTYIGYGYELGTRRLTGQSVKLEEATGRASNLTYTYDDAGNPTSITDSPAAGAADAQCFAYDGLRRLTQAWTPADANCATTPTASGLGGAAPYWFTDTFDPVGNRTGRVVHAAGGDTTQTYTYPAAGTDGAHMLTSVTSTGASSTTTNTYDYDDAGNTTTRAIAGSPVQTLTWDAEGELASLAEAGATTDSYLYTADGDRLIRRQDGVTTVYLPGGQELTLTAGQVKATRYYTFNGQTVAVRTGTGASGVTSLAADTHGTAQLSVHNTTRIITRRYTDSYGNPRGTAPAAWTGDHGFLDKPTDTTGLTQVGARYYDPAIARFISVDPVMDLANPQQWQGYAYANNNPITWSDPTGLAPMIDGQWGTARAAAATKKGQYKPGPPKPQGKALLIEFAEILHRPDPQAYVDRFHNLTRAERDALGVDLNYVSVEAATQDEIRSACEHFPCTPCQDTACQAKAAVTMVAGFAVGGALGRLFGKLLGRLAPVAKPQGAWFEVSNVGPNRPGTFVPESFDLSVAGETYSVVPNATKHMAEYATSTGAGWMPTSPFAGAVETAVERGLASGRNFLQVGNWELGIDTTDNVIYHAVYRP